MLVNQTFFKHLWTQTFKKGFINVEKPMLVNQTFFKHF